MQAGTAQQLERKQARIERAIEGVDQQGARIDVGFSVTGIDVERGWCARVALAGTAGFANCVEQTGHIAKTEVEPLRADRWEGVQSLAGQRHAALGGRLCDQALEGKKPARANAFDAAEKPVQTTVQLGYESAIVQLAKAGGFFGTLDPNDARGLARQWHGGERACRPVQLGRDIGVRSRVLDARHDSGLRIAPPPCTEIPESPARGLPTVGTNHKTDIQDAARVEGCRNVLRTTGKGGNIRVNNGLRWRQSAQSVHQRVDERRIGNIQAELRQVDIASFEDDFRGSDQMTGVVDQPDRAKRANSIRRQGNTEVSEKAQRGLKKRKCSWIQQRLNDYRRFAGQRDGVPL